MTTALHFWRWGEGGEGTHHGCCRHCEDSSTILCREAPLSGACPGRLGEGAVPGLLCGGPAACLRREQLVLARQRDEEEVSAWSSQ